MQSTMPRMPSLPDTLPRQPAPVRDARQDKPSQPFFEALFVEGQVEQDDAPEETETTEREGEDIVLALPVTEPLPVRHRESDRASSEPVEDASAASDRRRSQDESPDIVAPLARREMETRTPEEGIASRESPSAEPDRAVREAPSAAAPQGATPTQSAGAGAIPPPPANGIGQEAMAAAAPLPTAIQATSAPAFVTSAVQDPMRTETERALTASAEAEIGLSARSTDAATRIRSTGSVSGLVTAEGTDAVHEIVRAAIATKGDGTVTLRLDPSELGRLEIVFSVADDRLSIAVTAEREDALDMMRRASDELSRMLRQAGIDFDGLNFSQGGSSDERTGHPFHAIATDESGDGTSVDRPSGNRLSLSDVRLDIRV